MPSISPPTYGDMVQYEATIRSQNSAQNDLTLKNISVGEKSSQSQNTNRSTAILVHTCTAEPILHSTPFATRFSKCSSVLQSRMSNVSSHVSGYLTWKAFTGLLFCLVLALICRQIAVWADITTRGHTGCDAETTQPIIPVFPIPVYPVLKSDESPEMATAGSGSFQQIPITL